MKDNWKITLIIVLSVCIAGELKIYPFHETFRISFSVPLFLFFLLFFNQKSIILTGLITAISVVLFRVGLDWIRMENFYLATDFSLHFPTFFYYLTYSLLFTLMKVNSLHSKPFLVGFFAALIEISSSTVELAFRHYFLEDFLSFTAITEVSIIAFIRSFFVLGFFNIIKLEEAKAASIQQQEQNKYMLLLISDLYEESIQLKRTLQFSESITKECYKLYENLKSKNVNYKPEEIAQKLLGIAGQVHEIKKDNQRIYAGLSKMISEENSTDYMHASQIGTIVIETNETYAKSLNKAIEFTLSTDEDLPPLHVYTILSLLNNLVSNSVESIEDTGELFVEIKRVEERIKLEVSDTGVGILDRKKELIFKPGYTTKYDLNGKPSTGMGLTYVKEVVESLKGSIELDVNTEKTIFTIHIPINLLTEKG